jgi:hypothetical protein
MDGVNPMNDSRRHPRMPGNHRAAVIYAGLGAIPVMCTVADISEGGVGLTVINVDDIPDTFRLEIKGEGKVRSCRVAWKKAPHRMGVAFVPESSE